MEPSYDYIIQIGSYFLGRWLPVSHKKGIFIGRKLRSGAYAVLFDISLGT